MAHLIAYLKHCPACDRVYLTDEASKEAFQYCIDCGAKLVSPTLKSNENLFLSCGGGNCGFSKVRVMLVGGSALIGTLFCPRCGRAIAFGESIGEP